MLSRSSHLRRALIRIVCGIIGLLGMLPLAAQDLRYLSHQSWSTEEGLPQGSVHSIAQTTDGYIWAATEAGLVRFDGLHFEVFDERSTPVFTSSDICCLLPDKTRGLWIGTRDGLLHLSQGHFHRFGESDGLPSSDVLALTTNGEGHLNVTTAGGSKAWPNAQIATEAVVGSTSPWTWSSQEVHFHSPTGDHVWRTTSDLPGGRITAVLIDRSGVAWIGMSSGLVTVDPATRCVQTVPAFAGTSVLSLLQDAEGNHWIGTESSGLHILRQQEFRSLPQLAEQAITSVVQTADSAMWIGTRDGGLYRVRNGVVDQPIPSTRLTSPVILCLQPALDGSLWAGTPDGLNHISAAGKVSAVTSADGLPDDYIRSLAESPDGRLWVGTRHGLARVSPAARNSVIIVNGVSSGLIGSIFPTANDGLWVATPDGLTLLDADGIPRNFTARDGLPHTIITSIAQDTGGRLWVGGEDGTVLVLDGRRFVPVVHIQPDNHSNPAPQALLFDYAQSLWIRTNRGILRIRDSALKTCLAHHPCTSTDAAIVRFGVADGLRNDEVVPTSTAAPWLDRDGALWFPTRAGIAITNTRPTSLAYAPPPIVIQGMSLDELSMPVSGEMVQIPFGHERISIDYAALSFSAPLAVQYRYRLDGFDQDWKYAGNRRSASYTNLSPGTYNFKVQARNNDGTWPGQTAQLAFHIVPPIYRRWWFLLLASLLFLGFIVALYLLRLRRLRRRFDAVLAERNRMAREIHDTLTQDFVSTSLQLDIVAQQLRRGQVDQAIDQVKRARQLVTEGLTEARQSIWELRTNPSQETLPTRLLHLTQRETFVVLKPALEVRGAYRALEPRIEREVLRIASEALTNVRHHAAAQHTHVVLYYSSETLMLTIADDGSGFETKNTARNDGHYGLIGMQERASNIDATLEIASSPGRGTTITLRVPLTSASNAAQELH